MDNELELDLNEDNSEEIISRNKKKINSLSEKLGLSEKEKEELAKAKAEAEAKAESAQKDADFYKNFNSVSSKYEGASEYQDKIREKTALGLDVEEATMLVMAKEGKYTPPIQQVERQSQAGGSASMGINDSIERSPKEMSRADLLSSLKDLESQGQKLL